MRGEDGALLIVDDPQAPKKSLPEEVVEALLEGLTVYPTPWRAVDNFWEEFLNYPPDSEVS